MAGEDIERRLAAIVCADVVGYSRLMEADEEATIRALSACRQVVDELVAKGSPTLSHLSVLVPRHEVPCILGHGADGRWQRGLDQNVMVTTPGAALLAKTPTRRW